MEAVSQSLGLWNTVNGDGGLVDKAMDTTLFISENTKYYKNLNDTTVINTLLNVNSVKNFDSIRRVNQWKNYNDLDSGSHQ